MDELLENIEYWNMEEVLDRSVWRTRFGSGFGSVACSANDIFMTLIAEGIIIIIIQ